MPATSIFISAASSAMSGIGNSRISVLLGPVLTAARTVSTTAITSARFRSLLASTPERPGAVYRSMMLQFFDRLQHDVGVHQGSTAEEEPRLPRGAGSGTGVDARALRACAGRCNPRIGNRLRPPRLSAA